MKKAVLLATPPVETIANSAADWPTQIECANSSSLMPDDSCCLLTHTYEGDNRMFAQAGQFCLLHEREHLAIQVLQARNGWVPVLSLGAPVNDALGHQAIVLFLDVIDP